MIYENNHELKHLTLNNLKPDTTGQSYSQANVAKLLLCLTSNVFSVSSFLS